MQKMIIWSVLLLLVVLAAGVFMRYQYISLQNQSLAKICLADSTEKLHATVYINLQGKVGGFLSTPVIDSQHPAAGAISILYDAHGVLITLDTPSDSPEKHKAFEETVTQLAKHFPITNTITCN